MPPTVETVGFHGKSIMTNKERFTAIVAKILRSGKDELLEYLEKSDFYYAPASAKYHGDYPGGLLEHSLDVYDQLQILLKAYPEIKCSEETAAIISLFHDLCKVNFYAIEKRNRKNSEGKWETYDAYSFNEKFCFGGHGSKSVFIIQQYMKLTAEEAVAINCHMGSYDNEHVGDSYEQFPLAWLLHVADEASTFLLGRKKE